MKRFAVFSMFLGFALSQSILAEEGDAPKEPAPTETDSSLQKFAGASTYVVTFGATVAGYTHTIPMTTEVKALFAIGSVVMMAVPPSLSLYRQRNPGSYNKVPLLRSVRTPMMTAFAVGAAYYAVAGGCLLGLKALLGS